MARINSHELSKLSHKDQVRFAMFCANQVRPKWVYLKELVTAFETVEMWLNNEITYKECQIIIQEAVDFWNEGRVDEVNQAPYHALNCVTSHEKASAGYAVYASGAVYNSIDARFSYEERNVIVQQQIDYYTELRYVDEILEKIILKGDI